MSSAFNYRHFEEPERKPEPSAPAPKRHRGWRVFGRIIAGLYLLVTILIIAAAALINTGRIHSAILTFRRNAVNRSEGYSPKALPCMMKEFVL